MAVDDLTYPQPILNRQGPAPSGAGGVAVLHPPPTTRTFPFSIRAGAAQRTSVSTPKLYGPVVITGWHVAKGGPAAGGIGIGLGKSQSAVTEVNVPIATLLPFTPFGQGITSAGTTTATPNHTSGLLDMQTSLNQVGNRPALVALEPELFIVIYCATQVGIVPQDVVGYITVAERVSLEALANFL